MTQSKIFTLGYQTTHMPRTVENRMSNLRFITSMLRQMGYKNEILLYLNTISDLAKIILLVMPLGTTHVAILHNELLERDVNQIVQRMMSLRPDIDIMRFVDNELDRDKIIVAFKTGVGPLSLVS
jgi:hypothetical protein